MARKLFNSEYNYGAVEKAFYIDETGNPFVIEKQYEMRFHGWGDHIGTPGAQIGTNQYSISFAELRDAAARAGEEAFLNIDEKNWDEIVRSAVRSRSPKRKRR